MLSMNVNGIAISFVTLLLFQCQFTNASRKSFDRWPVSFGRRNAFTDNNQESSASKCVMLPNVTQRYMESTQFNCDNLHNLRSIMSNTDEEEGILGRCPSKLVVKTTINGQSFLEIKCQCLGSKCHNENSECREQKKKEYIGNKLYYLTSGCFCQRRQAISASMGTLPRKP